MEQLPAATILAAVPLTVHTAGVVDAKDTARPELDVATRARGAAPTVWLAGTLKLMDCAMGCVSDPLPPQALSATMVTRAQARNKVFRTGWLM